MSEPSPTETDYCDVFNHPDADIILRSSDNVHFKTFKTILSLSSPIFKDMLSIPQPPTSRAFSRNSDPLQSYKDGLPVVPLSGNCSAVKALLSFCHPCENPTLGSLEELKAILELARMFEITFIPNSVEPQLVKFAEEEPLRVYAIACIYEMRNVAVQAVRFSLRKPVDEIFPGRYAPLAIEYELISAQSIFRLQRYRVDCVAVIMGMPSNDFRNLLCGWTHHCLSCAKRSNSGKSRLAPYWSTFNDRALEALRERPCGDTVLSLRLLAPSLKMICEDCPDKTAENMAEYVERLSKHVDMIIAKVEITLPF
ncbi:hypothetical protein JAAARDRAFT_208147 [Jaapia argillacea MUCL 33604]|uniref:BTB domain-containing protein n=1 Tax=Jaapia argillacea MUCL 33604 TaxID=933084 RepID=A0A067Q1L2_9AGAM|nr:hypothetical protein JAAARDRAFT_208147 [Jaapia argillacea MUCL 33604]